MEQGHEADPPGQAAELEEDLVAFVLHLAVNAQDLHPPDQGLQGLPIVLHAGAGATGGDRG